ncbi:MAG: BamA/TamA family outer membrane protein [Marinilabiliaceae bacterium]|nr:BamA/TamA family outer membrane protein [Marinilabiliaceae bacterium]
MKIVNKILLIIAFYITLICNSNASENDSIFQKKDRTIGILPAIAFDSDLGFQYGILSNLYWFGKPSTYPTYQNSLYLEASKYTAGSLLLRTYFDSKKIITNIRTIFDITFFRDQMMDFYGFNGSQSFYNKHIEKDFQDGEYISKAFYKHHRDLFRIMANFKGSVFNKDNKLQWIGGITFFNFNIHPVDTSKIDIKANTTLTDITNLYDKYINWGIINKNEKNGGNSIYLKAGLSIDTRNFESNPSKGIFSELFISATPAFFSDHDQSYTRLTAVHRQYFTLAKNKSIIAYRVLYQGKIAGKVPYYLLPHIVSSSLGSATNQGLGGAKSLRGIKRNRVVGDGIILSNIELRQTIVRFNTYKQDIYIATNIFTDMGMVVQPYNIDLKNITQQDKELYFNNNKDELHTTLGIGIKVVLNENFIVSLDYGKALNKQDGDSGTYISLNYLF